MRTKSYVAPANPRKGDRWISPVQSVPVFDRVWNGTAWEDYVEPAPTPRYPRTETTPAPQDPPKDPPQDSKSTEETKGEQRNETAVSDRDGQQEPDAGAKQPADGKQGKGGQGKRGK